MSLAPDHAISLPVSDLLGGLVARVRARHESGRDGIVEMPLPALDVYGALANWAGDAVLWTAPSGTAAIGFGTAARLTASGRGRFHEIGIAARELFARFDTSECSAPLRLYAGFAFADELQSDRWDGFAAADAVLPEICAESTSEGARLRVAVRSECDVDGLVSRVELAVAALLAPPPAAATPVTERSRAMPGDYRGLVEDVLNSIRRGDARKIVVARRFDLTLSGHCEDAGALAELRSAYPGCHRFAFRRDGATFVGASPEPLVSVKGRHVRTVALAGSAAASAEGEAALRASAKDAAEHAMVVEHVRDALEPFCDTLEIAETPRVRRLRHILHLETPVAGELGRPMNVLRLAALLHPTPAVGGVPSEAAAEWITHVEGADRGWYAGPVGWFDAAGDGELAVAIRSGLLRGDEVSLWAGAGIVAASNAELEEAETLQKLQPLLHALGVEG